MSNRTFYPESAKIYRIYSPKNSDIGEYIGSTCISLNKRFQEHKRSFRKFVNRGKPMENSCALLMFDDVKIEELQNCSHCKSRQELEEIEYDWIQKSQNCLNKFTRNH